MPRKPSHWRHSERDGVSNHQCLHCLLNCWSRRGSKKISKLRVTGLWVGIHRWPMSSPHKRPVTRKIFPLDDVIVISCIWPSEWNHSIYQIHYTGVTWALWRLGSLATPLIIQHLLRLNNWEDNMSILTALCEGNPPVTSCSPNKGPAMQKVYYFDRNYSENHSWGTSHFSDGLFYWRICITGLHSCFWMVSQFIHRC